MAEGRAAQGEAGRMGHHAIRLLIMEPGTSFRVSIGGRGEGCRRYVRWDGARVELGDFDELFPPSESDAAREL